MSMDSAAPAGERLDRSAAEGSGRPGEYRFDLSGGRLCLDFVNTLSGRATSVEEHLNAYADLVAFGRQSGELGTEKAEALVREAARSPARARHVLRDAVGIREVLYRTFLAVAEGARPRPADVEALNGALREAMARARIELEAGEGCCAWCWDEDAGALDRPLWPVLRSAAELLTTKDVSRVRVCDAKTCQWLFLDTSRNRSRRWCDMKVCGNRAKAQRHYRKRKAAT